MKIKNNKNKKIMKFKKTIICYNNNNKSQMWLKNKQKNKKNK